MRKKIAFLLVLVFVLLFAATANAAEVNSASNRFLFDQTVTDAKGTAGDLVAMGSDVKVSGPVSGDLIAMGNMVDVKSENVDGNIFAAGNTVSVSSASARNIYAAGNSVAVGCDVAGGSYLAGSTVVFAGKTTDLYASGGIVTLSGTVTGDAVVHADKISFSDSATVDGSLTIYAPEKVMLPASIDASKVHFFETETNSGKSPVRPLPIGRWIISILSYAAIAVLMTLLSGKYFKARSDEFPKKVGWAVLFGLITFIVAPIAAILLLFTVVGIPVSLLLLAFYVLALCLAPIFTGVVLGRLVFKNMNRYLSAMIGAAAVRILLIVPILGTVVFFACAFYALGAFIMNLKLNEKEPVVTEAAELPVA